MASRERIIVFFISTSGKCGFLVAEAFAPSMPRRALRVGNVHRHAPCFGGFATLV
ncbi:Hypothetical protein A7982_10091 [Minicystis rosea]|nr:Hypothetical protein A7982_10091 [Minicystis rosea]